MKKRYARKIVIASLRAFRELYGGKYAITGSSYFALFSFSDADRDIGDLDISVPKGALVSILKNADKKGLKSERVNRWRCKIYANPLVLDTTENYQGSVDAEKRIRGLGKVQGFCPHFAYPRY